MFRDPADHGKIQGYIRNKYIVSSVGAIDLKAVQEFEDMATSGVSAGMAGSGEEL